MGHASSAIEFQGASGHRLAARLDAPTAQAPRAYALFAHCFTCSKDTRAATFVAQALADAGIATLRFDFTGLGGSDGDFANTGFSSNVDDLVAAAAWLRANRSAPSILVGHSLGGAAVLAAASRVPEAVAVATINAPSEPSQLLRRFATRRDEIDARGEADVELAGRTFRITRAFVDDVCAQNVAAAVASLGRALIVFHSPRDTEVGIDHAARIFAAAKHPKSFVSLDDADHLLTRRTDARYVGAVLAAWASRYVGSGEPEAASGVPRDVVRVRESGAGKFRQDVAIGPHRLIVDEPVEAGGDDAGPSPYDLVLAALGACTAMTMRLYATHKSLPLERVEVDLRHEKIHAADCEDCETKDGRIDRIERAIRVEGPVDDAAKAKLLEIANRCPVHRTLHSEVSIATRLDDS